jgi:hypothetical protein
MDEVLQRQILEVQEQSEIVKSLGQEDEFFKSMGIDIEKGKGAQIGEVREYSGYKYTKMADGSWHRLRVGRFRLKLLKIRLIGKLQHYMINFIRLIGE